MKDFFSTLWGRVLAVLAAITMMLGIGAEAFSIYRSWQDSQIAANNIVKSRAEACTASVTALVGSTPLDKMSSANERIQSICDPDNTTSNVAGKPQRFFVHTAPSAENCDEKFTALLDAIYQTHDTNLSKKIEEKIDAFTKVCPITEEQRKAAIEAEKQMLREKLHVAAPSGTAKP